MTKLVKLKKSDFKIDWFSGTGAGGQHRNKNQVACRITHIETGISAMCQESRSGYRNKRKAFGVLGKRLIAHFRSLEDGKPEASNERVRTYNKPNNMVIDHASGHKATYKSIVTDGNIAQMIEARRNKLAGNYDNSESD